MLEVQQAMLEEMFMAFEIVDKSPPFIFLKSPPLSSSNWIDVTCRRPMRRHHVFMSIVWSRCIATKGMSGESISRCSRLRIHCIFFARALTDRSA